MARDYELQGDSEDEFQGDPEGEAETAMLLYAVKVDVEKMLDQIEERFLGMELEEMRLLLER